MGRRNKTCVLEGAVAAGLVGAYNTVDSYNDS